MAAIFLSAMARAVTVRVGAGDGSRIEASLHPGDVLRVELPTEPATGRAWGVRGPVPPQLVRLGATQRVLGGMMSNQGSSSFSWRAVAPGEGTLTLAYGTAGERAGNGQPQKTVLVQVNIAGQPLGPEEANPPAMSQLEAVAEYQRTSPCGDCSALTERLTLYRGPGEAPFVLRRTYHDAPQGTLTSVVTGNWTAARGTADPTATIDTLESAEGSSQYKLAGDRLIPLDAQQVPIPTPAGMDLDFHRVATP